MAKEFVEVFQWNIPALQNWLRDKWEAYPSLTAFNSVAQAVNDLDNNLADWGNELPEEIRENIASFYADFVAHLSRLQDMVQVVNASVAAGLDFGNPVNEALAFGPMFYGARPNFESDSYVYTGAGGTSGTSEGEIPSEGLGAYRIAPEVFVQLGLDPDDNPFTDIVFDKAEWDRAQHGQAEWVVAFALANRAAMAGAAPVNWLINFGEFLAGAWDAYWEAMPEGMRAGVSEAYDSWVTAARAAADTTLDAMGNFGAWVADKAKGGALWLLAAGAVALGIVVYSRR